MMNARLKLVLAGLLSGLVFMLSWVVFHFLYVAGKEQPEYGSGESLGYLTMLIALSTVYFGVRNYRDKQLNGIITFKEAFLNGMIVVLVASFFYVFCWMIYYPNFIPDFMEHYSATQYDTYVESGLSGEELDMKMKEIEDFNEQYTHPLFMAGITFLEVFPVGLIVALVSALLLRKKP